MNPQPLHALPPSVQQAFSEAVFALARASLRALCEAKLIHRNDRVALRDPRVLENLRYAGRIWAATSRVRKSILAGEPVDWANAIPNFTSALPQQLLRYIDPNMN